MTHSAGRCQAHPISGSELHLDLALALPHFVGGLWVHRGAPVHRSVGQLEAGPVTAALDAAALIDQTTLGKRAPLVRAQVFDREDALATAHEHYPARPR